MARCRSLVVLLLALTTALSASAHPLTSALEAKSALRGVKIEIGDLAAFGVPNCLRLKEKTTSSTTIASDELFSGEQFDPNLGFYYLRARHYNPQNGRFPTMDPWGGMADRPATLNKYRYADGNPINLIDPSGYASIAEELATLNVATILATGVAVTGIALNVVHKGDAAPIERAKAEQCAKAHSNTTVTGKICGDVSLPIVFHQQIRMPTIFEHVLVSQALTGQHVLSRSVVRKTFNRAIAMKTCFGGGAFNSWGFPNISCDEYPFASTWEGGVGATTMWVPIYEQWSQGGTLSSFYSICNVSADLPSYNEFVVIPVESAPTGFQCNYFN